MKPLVNYCRWQGAKLRLRGRDDSFVWGQLIYISERGQERPVDFRFNLKLAELTIHQDSNAKSFILDEMGIVI